LDMLNTYSSGDFPGGKLLIYDASNNGVSLPMTTSHFSKFTQQKYDCIYSKLASGEINLIKDTSFGNDVNIIDIPVPNITLVRC
ncbi:MAG: BMP family ABC transporter substrate-binding protein, partial [Ruthenibacterium sp.]